LYYKKAAIVLLVYSVTDYESFDALEFWKQELENNNETDCIKFVVGSKIDDNELEEGEAVPKQAGMDFAKRINGHFFLTSAKENIGITKMFTTAAELCAQHPELSNDIDVS
jgi:Ras-related protein Rab-23